MAKKFNTLRFELFDAAEEHEKWILGLGYKSYPAVKIFVDDRELNSLFVEIEDREKNLHHKNANEVYGHHSPYALQNELTSSSVAECGAFLNCCSDCGFPDCWGVNTFPLITQDFVIWQRFTHTHKPYKYDLEFCFEKKAYETQLEILKRWERQTSDDPVSRK